ncbi:MAG: hypothetical protein ACRDQX_07625 [Pseudonocardiaceae bacterium]
MCRGVRGAWRARDLAEAVRDLNRLELAGESVRAVLEVLAVTAPGWLGMLVDLGEWGTRHRAPGRSMAAADLGDHARAAGWRVRR